jgi:hypothetical protein
MTVIGLDPGPVKSAYVVWNGGLVMHSDTVGNEIVLERLRDDCWDMAPATLVIEQVACMGMAVGAEVFETVFWTGRFCQAWRAVWHRIKRHEVKMHLCGNMRAKDANIRQALIDRLGPPGTKKAPGPTYGVHGDQWQALAVAVTWSETKRSHLCNTANIAENSSC